MINGADRYSYKADDYVKYRPNFPDQIIQYLYANGAFNNTSVIADIGSGTGRFTRLLLKNGNLVYGVEQNNEMRHKAEEVLSHFSNFISIAGSAEKTGLNDKSLDLITVAQAFHWFNKDECLLEFKRIIRDNGRVFIIWDDFVNDYNDFSLEYSNVLSTFSNIELENKLLSRTKNVTGFFKKNKFEMVSFTRELYQEFKAIKGGALSASFTPKPDEKNYQPFIHKLQKIFDKYQEHGMVCTAFRSISYLGEII